MELDTSYRIKLGCADDILARAHAEYVKNQLNLQGYKNVSVTTG